MMHVVVYDLLLTVWGREVEVGDGARSGTHALAANWPGGVERERLDAVLCRCQVLLAAVAVRVCVAMPVSVAGVRTVSTRVIRALLPLRAYVYAGMLRGRGCRGGIDRCSAAVAAAAAASDVAAVRWAHRCDVSLRPQNCVDWHNAPRRRQHLHRRLAPPLPCRVRHAGL